MAKLSEVCGVCRTHYPEKNIVPLFRCCTLHKMVVETNSIKRDTDGVIVDVQLSSTAEARRHYNGTT